MSPPTAHGGGFASFTSLVSDLERQLGVEITHVESRGNGSGLRDLAGFVAGLLTFALMCLRRTVDACHLNVAVRGSVYRKLLFLVIAHLTGVPAVVHVHSGRFGTWVEGTGRIGRWMASRLVRMASLVLVVTPGLEADVVGLGARDGSVRCVPNATRWPKLAREAPEQGRVLFVGRFVAMKGIDVLVRALERPWQRGLLGRVVIAGGQGDVDVERLVAASTIPRGRVEVMSWLDGAEVHRQFARAAVFALPSRSEGAPLVLLEAMSLGTPAVATAVGDVTRMLRGRGWVVQPDDADAMGRALVEALEDPVEAERRGRLGRAYWLENHTPEMLAHHLGEVYGTLISQRRGRRHG